mmetsp:Transcript_9801/g.40412  ORF Transcript_9801/g.40412 Transcript_9801/m.40412 type:complete len:263 (-) Transcript_9801:57-845(-)
MLPVLVRLATGRLRWGAIRAIAAAKDVVPRAFGNIRGWALHLPSHAMDSDAALRRCAFAAAVPQGAGALGHTQRASREVCIHHTRVRVVVPFGRDLRDDLHWGAAVLLDAQDVGPIVCVSCVSVRHQKRGRRLEAVGRNAHSFHRPEASADAAKTLAPFRRELLLCWQQRVARAVRRGCAVRRLRTGRGIHTHRAVWAAPPTPRGTLAARAVLRRRRAVRGDECAPMQARRLADLHRVRTVTSSRAAAVTAAFNATAAGRIW